MWMMWCQFFSRFFIDKYNKSYVYSKNNIPKQKMDCAWWWANEQPEWPFSLINDEHPGSQQEEGLGPNQTSFWLYKSDKKFLSSRKKTPNIYPPWN